MTLYESIIEVVKYDLCTGCGTCVSLCPVDAIFMEHNKSKGTYEPKIIPEKCNNCKICLKVCPGYNVDFKHLNKTIFESEPENSLVGNFKEFYIGYSNDSDIRYMASSGGVITQLLVFALENRLIDGALVSKMDPNNPLETVSYIARTKQEIIASMGSKYCPVSLNVGLKQILNAEKGQKFAVVGLPCHIHGLRKAESLNLKLKDKILFTIGIICSKCQNFLATEYMLKKFKIDADKIDKLSYRGNGYPGGLTVSLKNGTEKFYGYKDYYDTCFGQFFSPPRCRLCIDFTSELSDISCGDVFFSSEYEDTIGSSIIISRNSFSEELLKKAHSHVTIKPIEPLKFVNGCSKNISFKKSEIYKRGQILNKEVPHYEAQTYLSLTFYNTVFLYIYMIGNYLACNKDMWTLLNLYGKLIKFVSKFI